MRMCLTSESTILPKVAPMIIPMARSMTLPLKAKFLNSSNKDHACRVGTTDAIRCTGSILPPPRDDESPPHVHTRPLVPLQVYISLQSFTNLFKENVLMAHAA